MRTALILAFSLLAGCSSLPSGFPGSGLTKTFDAPIARVKPAFVSSVVQMGMSIAAVETRGKIEILKARRADKSVEIELERLGANSTRVRISGSDEAHILRETEKRLRSG